MPTQPSVTAASTQPTVAAPRVVDRDRGYGDADITVMAEGGVVDGGGGLDEEEEKEEEAEEEAEGRGVLEAESGVGGERSDLEEEDEEEEVEAEGSVEGGGVEGEGGRSDMDA